MTADVELCDRFDGALGWTATAEFLQRTSHALAADGGVWLVDPVDFPDLEQHVRALGEPRGVVQLIDRHERDGAVLADRLRVPLYRVPRFAIPGAPFEFVPMVRMPLWREVALWWPDARTLVVGDALGTIGYFVARGERLGVHPLLRPWPPAALGRYDARHVLCGHGAGIHGDDAAALVREALATARRRLPAAWLSTLRRTGRRALESLR